MDALTFGDVTPLHVACKLGDRRLVSLLVSRGADPRLQSVERQRTAGSGTESGDEEGEERTGAEEEDEEHRLDAFLYADMAGDPTVSPGRNSGFVVLFWSSMVQKICSLERVRFALWEKGRGTVVQRVGLWQWPGVGGGSSRRRLPF